MTVRFSVVIPTLNEARYLPECLLSIRAALPHAEVIVVDGGSQDATIALGERHGARVFSTQPSRGGQCRFGAERARGDALCFLHADSQLAPDAEAKLQQFLADPEHRAGTFRVRYEERGMIYRFLEWGSQLDSVWSSLGDQGILVRRSLYEQVGGMPALPLFEDVLFFQRLRTKTRVRSIPAQLTISARRFRARGVYRQLAHNLFLTLLYLRGASPAELAGRYRAKVTDPGTPVDLSSADGA